MTPLQVDLNPAKTTIPADVIFYMFFMVVGEILPPRANFFVDMFTLMYIKFVEKASGHASCVLYKFPR